MTVIQDSIVIDREAEIVRKVFLDFAAYPTWKSSCIQKITVTTPSKTSNDSIVPGDTLQVRIVLPNSKKENVFDPEVVENSEERFSWKGKLVLDSIFSGKHTFEFCPIENGSKTKFVQTEEFNGLLAWPILKFIGKDTVKGFSEFNQRFKEHVEKCEF
ncbi:hypothetical protein HG536_0G04970 [Torulaspora globosa]|uniref:Coenzyme Q-binding protein COQ10 START domain-containing protein n=1 Tax=Torulaspora globosa TaxID=48254 RepID=A0A7G3ZM98_9SACH|nr:uncharacterized protein HG536_0G04970 [Torulaspora globosa]QLL34634.1 hypothetical protein HG536_0G04970 [Torulaspora globosa]